MTDTIILITYSILYFVAFSWIGGRYSSEMQNLYKLKVRMKSDKFDHEKLSVKIEESTFRVKKIKSLPFKIYSPLLLNHILLNWLTLNSIDFYYYIVISCICFVILMLGVFLLKGHGTIDSNPRMPGGLRL